MTTPSSSALPLRACLLGAAYLLFMVVVYLGLHHAGKGQSEEVGAPESTPPATAPDKPPATKPLRPPMLPAPPTKPATPSLPPGTRTLHMAKALNAPGRSPSDDITILGDILISFQTSLKRGNPVGTNREITATLTGQNQLRLEWIAPDHPAIEGGQLCDRWGTPFFFHQISAHAMGIRSAGPDRERYTDDDTFYDPPPPQPGGL